MVLGSSRSRFSLRFRKEIFKIGIHCEEQLTFQSYCGLNYIIIIATVATVDNLMMTQCDDSVQLLCTRWNSSSSRSFCFTFALL